MSKKDTKREMWLIICFCLLQDSIGAASDIFVIDGSYDGLEGADHYGWIFLCDFFTDSNDSKGCLVADGGVIHMGHGHRQGLDVRDLSKSSEQEFLFAITLQELGSFGAHG